ncbi:MAG: hypothetical protein WCW29_02015 [Candidatus Paceibacterota bacterium]
MGNFKSILLLVLTLSVFIYVIEGTTHELTVPEDQGGEVVVNVTDAELEDNVNNLLKIPLKLFPRVLCLENNNKVTSDGIEVNRKIAPEAGEMNLFVEKDGIQVVEKINVSVEETLCESVDLVDLEGAKTTANYKHVTTVKLEMNPNGSIEITGVHQTNSGFQTNTNVDVSKTRLWVGFSPVVNLFLLVISFLTISASVLTLVELIKRILIFINEDQFP